MTRPASPTAGVTVRTPAKINLALGVGARRADGYHALATVYQAVSLYDEVRARPAPAGEITVVVDAEDAAFVPTDASNLAVRAARLLAAECDLGEGVTLEVRKGIPVAGGMAGGSSDAAGALVACAALWEVGLARADLMRLAARLGSDVPFCLLGGTAVGTGRGEEVASLPTAGEFHWVAATAADGLATAAVYAELDRMRAAGRAPDVVEPSVSGSLTAALRDGSPHALGAVLANDLEPPALALRPELAATLEEGRRSGALGALVSGSGPTTLFLAADEEHARRVAARLGAAGVGQRVHHVVGPVDGAQVIG